MKICEHFNLRKSEDNAFSQQTSKEELIFLTPLWKGERFADGRPKVPDNILSGMKAVSVEEVWATMKNAGLLLSDRGRLGKYKSAAF